MARQSDAQKEKNKAADAAVAQIKEKFGDGSIMKLGEGRKMTVESIPTGCLSLDIALGVGGVPKGRIIEIYGPESSGKCVSRDTMVFTDRGMLPIDAFGRLSRPEFQQKETFVYAEHSFEKTSHFYNGGLRKTFRVNTGRGFTLEGTPNHRIRVLDRWGHYLFRRLDELQDDDHIAIQRNQQCFGPGVDLSPFKYTRKTHDHSSKQFTPPPTITREWALLMGYLVGDGTCTATGFNKNNIQITVGDPETEQDLQTLCRQLFSEQAKVTLDRRNNVKRLVIHNVQARTFLAYAGLGFWNAAEKQVPWSILCSPKETVAAFVSALFECDGCFSGATIEYCTKSELLARYLQTILLNFGIIASHKTRIINKYGPFHYLYIEGQIDKQRFAEQIGFRSKRKQQSLLQNLAQRKMSKTNFDVIPHINGVLEQFIAAYKKTCRPCNRADWDLFYDYLPKPRGGGHAISYDRAARLLQHFSDGRNIPQYQTLEQLTELGFYWDTIKTVKPSTAHVVDFTVPKGATFFGNGFVNHNTTLAQHIVAEVQKQGGLAAFVDAEHALDPEYAKKIGVRIEDLLISQPDNGEQALDIVETLVRSGAVDVIVVDSVAALTPRAEIEGEMGDSHMGLQARLMSQALRKLTGIISKSNTCLIFINQIRMKIGVMFGNPETTTGGNALKFYCSVRIDVRRAAQIKQGDQIIGNRVKAKIVKNKVAPPFRLTEFDIMYNEGISIPGDVLDTAVVYNVVDKSGNSYIFEGARLGVGRETAKKFLKDNPAVLAAIRAKVLEAVADKERAVIEPEEAKAAVGAGVQSDE